MRRQKRNRPERKQAALFMLALALAAGIVAGAFAAALLENAKISAASLSLPNYFHHLSSASPNLWLNIFKFAKFVLLLWFFAFFPAGGFGVFALIALKGAGYGFTGALVFRQLGFSGLFAASLVALPQCLMTICAGFIVAYSSIAYILFQSNAEEGLSNHFSALAKGLLLAAAAGLIDTAFVPFLASLL